MSWTAEKRIAAAKRAQSRFLDIGNCGLRVVPPEIADLSWLEGLSVARTWHEWDGSIWRMKTTDQSGPRNDAMESLEPLAGLVNLRRLYLAGTRIDDLTPLARLNNLQELHLQDTEITSLDFVKWFPRLRSLVITHTRVANLEPLRELDQLQALEMGGVRGARELGPLRELRALRSLNVSGTEVRDLAPLKNLDQLRMLDAGCLELSAGSLLDLPPLTSLRLQQSVILDPTDLCRQNQLVLLDVSHTDVRSIDFVAEMHELEALDLSHTKVGSLAPVRGLAGLRRLSASHSRVSDLVPLAGLKAIEELLLAHCEIESLRPLMQLTSLRLLEVHGNPLKHSGTPPTEILQQGNEAVLNYILERGVMDVEHLYEAKMLIVGEGRAGKTSLLRRLYAPNQALPSEDETTRGIAILRHSFALPNGQRFRLNVWDFGGQQIYHATHQFFLTRRSLYLLVDDTGKDDSAVSDPVFRYWLQLIDLFGGHSPTLIFQNEKGGRSKPIDLDGIRNRYDNVIECHAGNLEQPDSVDSLRIAIEREAGELSHVGEELPARWISIRLELEALAGRVPFIPVSEYFSIYERHLPPDREKALHLSRYLHDLGVFLHFQDDRLLARVLVLQNEWATAAVFRVLDDELIKAAGGRFSEADCARLWHERDYVDMHPELLALMERFELCYLLANSAPRTFLATQLLPPAKPQRLRDWAGEGDLSLHFAYEFMPKGLVSRLTVRLHRFVSDPNLAWANGVLFQHLDDTGTTELLVETSALGDEISLRARGLERRVLLSVVAGELDSLNATFDGLQDKVEKKIPCPCSKCLQAERPEFYLRRKLLKRQADGRHTIECDTSYESVNVDRMLDGTSLVVLPVWARPIPHHELRPVTVFLASAAELAQDRDTLELYIRQFGDALLTQGILLKVLRWETSVLAMDARGIQERFNDLVRDCDIFVSLFFTKAGKFTQMEFDVAHSLFVERGRPQVYVYFKDADVRLGRLDATELAYLEEFKSKLALCGHYGANFTDGDDLGHQFKAQLEQLLRDPSRWLTDSDVDSYGFSKRQR